jgi:AcrR family transcriptional regulator
MKTKNRREREFHQREEEFLELARRIITESGLVSFNMDRLAEATEYSKGTIYQHFGSKEDVLTALAVQSLNRRIAWFERASKFNGTSRERMYALNAAEEIFVKLQPLHFRCEMLIKMGDYSKRASAERRSDLEAIEDRCLSSVRGVVEQAVRNQELTLPAHRSIGDIVICFAAMHIGTFTILNNFPEILVNERVDHPLRALRDLIVVYMDGLGWRPLSAESDPEPSYRRILEEVFPNESRQAGLVG